MTAQLIGRDRRRLEATREWIEVPSEDGISKNFEAGPRTWYRIAGRSVTRFDGERFVQASLCGVPIGRTSEEANWMRDPMLIWDEVHVTAMKDLEAAAAAINTRRRLLAE